MTNTDVNDPKVESEPTKKAVAKHALIDAQGAEVDSEETATGIRYTLLANGERFDYQTGKPAGEPTTMLAIFGAKTLATNETSQSRNNPKGAGSADEQIEAVRDRFALIESGTWIDRTREPGVGTVIDKDVLATAMENVMTAEGKADSFNAKGGRAKVLERLNADKIYVRNVRQVPAIRDEYIRLVGKTVSVRTTDDLLGSL